MPVRLIGKKSWFVGKLLFEILNNLKHYGVGRVVCRNSYKKFPEMCYYVVRKVVPMREIIGHGPDELVYGKVWVEEVFKGKKFEELHLIDGHTAMPDWYLIPKEEEDKYLKYDSKEVVKIIPKYDSVPPVIGELMKQKDPSLKEVKMERIYLDLANHLSYKIAEDGMTPDHKLKVQIPDEFKIGVKYPSDSSRPNHILNKSDPLKQSTSYTSQREFHSLATPRNKINTPTNLNMQISRMKSNQGFKQKLRTAYYNMMGDKNKVNISAALVYEKCADTIDYHAFMRYFKLPDTFNSWFLSIELHVWILSLVAISEKQGRYFRNRIVDEMWNDVEQRLEHLGELKSSTKKGYLKELVNQFHAALISYDEGILDDDKALAASAWRTLYDFRTDIDPRTLEALVIYIRKQIKHLDSLNSEELILYANVSFLALEDALSNEIQPVT